MIGMLDLSPNAHATHWCAQYIGRAWTDRFNCWDLVRTVQFAVFGRTLPRLPIGGEIDEQRAQDLQALLSGPGWQAVQGYPPAAACEGDVLLMRGPDGPHVGVVVLRACHAPAVLHNVGGLLPDGPRRGQRWGGVRLDAIDALGRLGYGRLKLWRAVP
jgi:cell wall-associated NlpC family hydrolase